MQIVPQANVPVLTEANHPYLGSQRKKQRNAIEGSSISSARPMTSSVAPSTKWYEHIEEEMDVLSMDFGNRTIPNRIADEHNQHHHHHHHHHNHHKNHTHHHHNATGSFAPPPVTAKQLQASISAIDGSGSNDGSDDFAALHKSPAGHRFRILGVKAVSLLETSGFRLNTTFSGGSNETEVLQSSSGPAILPEAHVNDLEQRVRALFGMDGAEAFDWEVVSPNNHSTHHDIQGGWLQSASSSQINVAIGTPSLSFNQPASLFPFLCPKCLYSDVIRFPYIFVPRQRCPFNQ